MAWQTMDNAPQDRDILVKDAIFGVVIARWDGAYRWMVVPRSTDLFGLDQPLLWTDIPPEDAP
jgi:hypothetical protein